MFICPSHYQNIIFCSSIRALVVVIAVVVSVVVVLVKYAVMVLDVLAVVCSMEWSRVCTPGSLSRWCLPIYC